MWCMCSTSLQHDTAIWKTEAHASMQTVYGIEFEVCFWKTAGTEVVYIDTKGELMGRQCCKSVFEKNLCVCVL